jgi:hypothetical protein
VESLATESAAGLENLVAAAGRRARLAAVAVASSAAVAGMLPYAPHFIGPEPWPIRLKLRPRWLR